MPTERDAAVGELAELRRRAYGPQSDIASDPVAQARLHDLEAAERAARSPVTGAPSVENESTPTEPPAGGPSDRGPQNTDSSGPDDASAPSPRDEPDADAGLADPETQASPRTAAKPPGVAARALRWARARLPWLIAAVAGVVAIVAVSTLVVEEFARPHAELSFGVRSVPMNIAKPTLTAADRDLRGIPSGALEFRGSVGKLDVWTLSGHEVRCLVFSSEGQIYWSQCAHTPLAPWSDFFTDESLVPVYSLDPQVPAGSFLRFEWDGDVVNVFVVRTSNSQAAVGQTPPVASLPDVLAQS